jgi:hypothetical protein
MNLSEHIKRIFDNNTRYALPEQAINQAESLKSLSRDLYTDSKRFIYELLQNADDSAFPHKKVAIHIRFFGNILLLAHTGQPFNVRDLEGLCSVSHGTKKDSIEKTGYKGIGFKAAFGQSNKVIVYSQKNYFRFDEGYNFDWRNEWGKSQQEWEVQNERTFLYPWQIIPIETKEDEIPQEIKSFLATDAWSVATLVYLNNAKDVEKAVSDLIENVNMFLFLKNIEYIEFKTHKLYEISVHRTGEKIKIKENGIQKVEWLSHSKQLVIPPEIKRQIENEQNIPDKLKKASQVELTLAAKIKDGQLVSLSQGEQLLYAYLPTDEKRYFLPVLVNANFLTSANRESLHVDSVWNQWLFECIAMELYKWIAELVKSEYQYQAYNLIPKKLYIEDALSNKYQEGINKALESIPFIISEQGALLKRNQAILDFTFLFKKSFVGDRHIRDFVITRDNRTTIESNPFVAYTGYGNKFKDLGVSTFEWKDMPVFLKSSSFKRSHSIEDNIRLIKHLKYLCENDEIKDVTNTLISKWDFIYDHKDELKNPSQIYFPEPDDENWNNPQNELSFLHEKIQNWLLGSLEERGWLETLGIIEKTDLTYLKKTILENSSTYINNKNAIQTIQTIFKLYSQGEVSKELLSQLCDLKLLTRNGNLIATNQCYLSDAYKPRLPLENLHSEDIFVSESYISNRLDRDEWCRFFKMMGVKDGIEITKFRERIDVDELIQEGSLHKDYFDEKDKFFNPYVSSFKASNYSNILSLSFLSKSNDYLFAKVFWIDIIDNISLSSLNESATAFWGRHGMAGQVSGDTVENYIKWHVCNQECLPTKMKNCRKASDTFINEENIIEVAGNYLPIFDGPQLSADWKSFFQFKTKFSLSDYLELLTNITSDSEDGSRIKFENKEKIQKIYSLLLDEFPNWSSEELDVLQEWADSSVLPDKSGILHPLKELRFYADGDISIFHDEFNFIFLNSPNRKHQYTEEFLEALGIEVFKQEKFNLWHDDINECSGLKEKLDTIVPYLEKWIASEESENDESKVIKINEALGKLKIYETSELKVTYNDWEKVVQFHLKDNVLHVTFPWNSNSSLMYLPDKLCDFLGIKGYSNELDFLLRSVVSEIHQHFQEEGIELPEEEKIEREKQTTEAINISEDPKEITPDDLISLGAETVDELKELLEKDCALSAFFHFPTASYDKFEYVQEIIRRAKINIKAYLETIGYDCSEATEIAPSIFGGIKKDGKDIYIVTRPSDNDEVLIYYTSEFDVLEYVDAEFWCEDGINTPKQITLGQLLKKTGINRIPIKNTAISTSDIESLFNTPKSETLDFSPIPYAPQEIARIISSFANTNGGTLIFGLKEISSTSNKVVGLSTDFQIIEITKKAISLLSPIPPINYSWAKNADNNIFVIKVEKSDSDILFENEKYIREGTNSIIEENKSEQKVLLNNPKIQRNIAIIIAIGEYAPVNQISKVKYAKEDALKFKETLIDVMKLSEDDIFMLTDEEAFKSHLEYNFQGLFHSLTEDDRLIFYYVGHGFHNGITNYLSTYDTHKHHIAATSVSLTEILLDPLRKSKCRNALIFIDACAQIFQDENQRTQISDINDEELIMLSHDFPYYAIFLSCQPGQSSYSSDVLKNGIWTHHLLQALSGNIKEVIFNGKYITDSSLRDYLSVSVFEYTKQEHNRDQNPRAVLDSSYENVIIEIL